MLKQTHQKYTLTQDHHSQRKQIERADRISNLPSTYHSPITSEEKTILSTSISSLVTNIHAKKWKPIDVLRAYGKKSIKAHEATNCLTEVMIKEAEGWVESCDLDGENSLYEYLLFYHLSMYT